VSKKVDVANLYMMTKKLNWMDGWMDGWMGWWVGGSKTWFKGLILPVEVAEKQAPHPAPTFPAL
jgi:hypothetical protein